MVNDLDWSSFYDTRGDRWVTKVSACIDNALIIEAYGASMDEPSLDQGLAKLTCCLKLLL